ncbi:MAG: zinc ABC transporter substrate-binding protein [Peptostreptococcaceae bacterium]|nr:zinc ABC transporter substrate-binding protein [Peptostreptococcaceae bacterium]
MHIKKIGLLIVFLALLLVLSSCAQNDREDKSEDKKFTVVTSFYPIYIATINVTKDIQGVETINMTKPQTGCLHDYQLTPEDLIKIEEADAFVANGAGMEAFIGDVLLHQKNLEIIDASQGIELIKDESGEENPHVWVSITNAIIQVRNIAEQLSSIDQNHSEQYKANADAYIAKLEILKEKMHQSLKNIKNRDIITFHEAFPYFAKEFDLNIIAVIEREPGTTPSPKELEATIKMVKDSGVKALFAEPQYELKSAQIIANETGAKIYTLDPIVTGEADAGSYDEYITVMEANLKTLLEALE